MQIILKFIIKNIQENKFRSFLILLAIVLSIALYFASNAVSYSFSKTIVAQLKSTYGQTDIVVKPNKDSKSRFISEYLVKNQPNIETVMGVNTSSGVYKIEDEDDVSFSLFGADIDKLKKINPFELVEKSDNEVFSGYEIIISSNAAEEYHLRLGDKIKLSIKNINYKFKITGIASPSTLFGSEEQSRFALVPKKTLDNILNTNGRSSQVYIKVTQGSDVGEVIDLLKNDLKIYKVDVDEAVNKADIESRLSNIKIPFMSISILVLIMSIFIIYTSFKVIMAERLPIIGTFRSIGATEKKTRNIMLCESLAYGVIGGCIGIPLGIAILAAMLGIISASNPRGLSIELGIQMSNVIYSFMVAVGISFFSAYIPIKKASKLPLKDVIFGKLEEDSEGKKKKYKVKLAILICAIIIPYVVPSSLIIPVGVLSILLIIIMLLQIVPVLLRVVTFLLEGVYERLFGSQGVLAIKEIKGNDNISQNIGLLALSISTMLFVYILSGTMEGLITNISQGAKYEITTVSMEQEMNKDLLKRLKTIKGVKEVSPIYQASAKDKDSQQAMGMMAGINANEELDFYDTRVRDVKDVKPLLNRLHEGRNILVNETVLSKLNLKVGDTVNIEVKKGYKPYKIIGILTSGTGDILAGYNYVKSDFDQSSYAGIRIKSDTPDETIKAIKEMYEDKRNFTATLEEAVKNMKSMFGILFGILKGFAAVLLIIGVFGIINNLVIDFLQRRRVIAMYKSVGMSKTQLTNIMIIKAFTSGLVGGLFGICTTILELKVLEKIMSASVGIVPIDYSIPLFIAAFVAGVVITLIGTIAPLLRGQKLQIIEAIKYE
ncbi:MAG TPA: hypothetical protein DCP90_00520 [Clostridiales bacterium]|nr:MAG: hypothetical protein A2Y22_02060 [Clostridiales bacterium GWD2_32_59]HAN09080.1 hypothetical protein [Clostridiales bacterium]